jgi:tryptophan synthase alpha chain
MNKISAAFSGQKAFVAYLMAGDPDLATTREYILTLARSGADVIELGLPFSDPIAEGEVIQEANLRAFAAGTKLEGIFEMVASLRGELAVPLLFMTYLNPIFHYGYDAFFKRAADCGVSGIIIPDLPFEEQAEVLPFTAKHGLDLITLIAPTSAERVARLAQNAQGYIYLVSSLGVTGARSEITTDIAGLVAAVRAHTQLPVAVGFGVHSPAQAHDLTQSADGVIVGSAIVSIIAERGADAAADLADYTRSMKAAMR